MKNLVILQATPFEISTEEYGMIIILLTVVGGFVFLNGKLAKWKGYPFWTGAISAIVLFWGTILFLVMPFNQKKKDKENNKKTMENKLTEIIPNGFLLKKQNFPVGIAVGISSILISFVDTVLYAGAILKDSYQYGLLFWGIFLEISMLFLVRKYLKNFHSENVLNWFTWLIIISGCIGMLGFLPDEAMESMAFFALLIIVAIGYIFISIKAGYAITKIPNDFIGNLKLFGQSIMYCLPASTIVAFIIAVSDNVVLNIIGFIISAIPTVIVIGIFLKVCRIKKPNVADTAGAILILLIFIFAISYGKNNITGEKESENIAYIKQSIYDDDYTLRLGDALENYIYFSPFKDGKTWREFQTQQGRTVVEFRGEYMGTDFTVKIQFLIHVDWEEDEYGFTYDVGFVGYSTDGDDWKKFSGYDGDDILERIYKNKELPYLSELSQKAQQAQTTNNNLITSTSIAGVEIIGKTPTEVKTILNQDLIWEKIEELDGQSEGYTIKKGQNTLLSLYTYSGKITFMEIYDSSFATKDGLHVGSTAGDIFQLYPNATVVMEEEEAQEYTTINGITYHFDDWDGYVGNGEENSRIVNKSVRIASIIVSN